MSSAIEKYRKRASQVNSLVCVGLDPDFEKLPIKFKQAGQPQFEFNKYIIDETAEFTAAFKPNIAFYEARGGRGLEELKLTMDYLRKMHPEIFTICDAKRADIANTNQSYVSEIFDWLGCDAVTLHPYMGKEALQPFLQRTDKVSIILCRTSNPGAHEIQDLEVNGKPVWQILAEKIRDEWNSHGNCMLMVGATYPGELKKVRELVGDMEILIAGITTQGGEVEAAMKAGLNSEKRGLIVNSSRAIIFSHHPGAAARQLRDGINLYR